MACRGLCSKLPGARKGSSLGRAGTGPYQMGLKGCRTCALFFPFEGARCPCCGWPLKVRQRPAWARSMARRRGRGL